MSTLDKSEKGFLLALTNEERETLRQLGNEITSELDGKPIGESNAIRRGLLLLMKQTGKENPSDKLFADRRAGNRLPKENRQFLMTANNAILAV